MMARFRAILQSDPDLVRAEAGERLGVFAGKQAPAMSDPAAWQGSHFAVQWSVRSWPWPCSGWPVVMHWCRPHGGGEPLADRCAHPAALMRLNARGVFRPDPVVTSSTFRGNSRIGFDHSAPLPRPARIERAGSILMIRRA
jgi:hypothetical protein